jgi:hypothetical protein
MDFSSLPIEMGFCGKRDIEMKRAAAYSAVLIFAAICRVQEARADDESADATQPAAPAPSEKKSVDARPSSQAPASSLQQGTDDEYFSNKLRQNWGHALLGSGLGVTLAGITLIEIDSWGNIGKAGFISVGAGLGISIIGMFFLGFSRPVHGLQPSRRISASPTSDHRGAAVMYEIYF